MISAQTRSAFVASLKEHGILVQAAGANQLRLVTHRHIDDSAVDHGGKPLGREQPGHHREDGD